MLKMALFNCVINKKCCIFLEDGAFALFFVPTPGGLTAQGSHPREFAIQGKKNANTRGSARGGAWAQMELTDAYLDACCSLIKTKLNCFIIYSKKE